MTPGPDYKLYRTPKYVDIKVGFEAIKAKIVSVGIIKAFENFGLPMPLSINANTYPAELARYEKFSMFISSTQLKWPFR